MTKTSKARAANSQRLTDNAKAEMATVTKVAPALARGAEGKEASTHCRKSLDDQRVAAKPAKPVRAPKPEPEVKAKRAQKANKAAKGAKLALKQNKEVRALLTKAAEAAGGTRLTPIGFDSYSAFLAGVPLDAKGNAEVVFIPVKGSTPITGKNVKLTIAGGKVVKVK